MNTIEWGVRTEKGVISIDPASANEAYMSEEQMAKRYAEVGGGEVVTRVRTSHTTPWTNGDTSWLPGCLDVLQRLLEERLRQVARYGLNDECEDGTGSSSHWLADTEFSDRRLSAAETEQSFREDYGTYEDQHGLPTWMHLIREEVAEAFAEDDLTKRNAEAIQAAALFVSWVESTVRRASR
jgi:hypothetical protein